MVPNSFILFCNSVNNSNNNSNNKSNNNSNNNSLFFGIDECPFFHFIFLEILLNHRTCISTLKNWFQILSGLQFHSLMVLSHQSLMVYMIRQL